MCVFTLVKQMSQKVYDYDVKLRQYTKEKLYEKKVSQEIIIYWVKN